MNCPHCRRALDPSDFARVPERDREAILRALTVRRSPHHGDANSRGPAGAFVVEEDGTVTFERHAPEGPRAVERRRA